VSEVANLEEPTKTDMMHEDILLPGALRQLFLTIDAGNILPHEMVSSVGSGCDIPAVMCGVVGRERSVRKASKGACEDRDDEEKPDGFPEDSEGWQWHFSSEEKTRQEG